KVSKLYQELRITDDVSLKEAGESKQGENLAGFGKRSADNILLGLEDASSRPERLLIAILLPIGEKIEAFLKDIPEVTECSIAGSLRRMRETVKDIDFIIATEKPLEVRDALLRIDNIKEVIANGE